MRNLIMNFLFCQYTRNIYIFWPQKFYKSVHNLNPQFIWNYPFNSQPHKMVEHTHISKFVWVCLTFLWDWRLKGYFNFSTLPYELRKGNKVNLLETRTCRYVINLVLFCGTLLWNSLLHYVKKVIMWNGLRKRLRNWESWRVQVLCVDNSLGILCNWYY